MYARLEVDLGNFMVVSDDFSCLITDYFFDGLAMWVLGSQRCNFLHEDREFLFLTMEVTAVRSSNVYMGEKLVPIEREVLH